MAEIISQNDIDDLFSSLVPDEETQEESQHKQKTYHHKENKNTRYSYPYQSPVIKKKRCSSIPIPLQEIYLTK